MTRSVTALAVALTSSVVSSGVTPVLRGCSTVRKSPKRSGSLRTEKYLSHWNGNGLREVLPSPKRLSPEVVNMPATPGSLAWLASMLRTAFGSVLVEMLAPAKVGSTNGADGRTKCTSRSTPHGVWLTTLCGCHSSVALPGTCRNQSANELAVVSSQHTR